MERLSLQNPESIPKWLQVVEVIVFYTSTAKNKKCLYRLICSVFLSDIVRNYIKMVYGQVVFCDIRYYPVPKAACGVIKSPGRRHVFLA